MRSARLGRWSPWLWALRCLYHCVGVGGSKNASVFNPLAEWCEQIPRWLTLQTGHTETAVVGTCNGLPDGVRPVGIGRINKARKLMLWSSLWRRLKDVSSAMSSQFTFIEWPFPIGGSRKRNVRSRSSWFAQSRTPTAWDISMGRFVFAHAALYRSQTWTLPSRWRSWPNNCTRFQSRR